MRHILNKVKICSNIVTYISYSQIQQYFVPDNCDITKDGVHLQKDPKILIRSFDSDSLTFVNYQNVNRLTKNIFYVWGVKSTWRPGKDNWEHEYSNVAIINSNNTIDWYYVNTKTVTIDLKDVNNLKNKLSILNSLYQIFPKSHNLNQLSNWDFNRAIIDYDNLKTSKIDFQFKFDEIISLSKYAMLLLLREIIFYKIDLIFAKNERTIKAGSLLQFKYDITNVTLSGTYAIDNCEIYIVTNEERLIIFGPINEIFDSPFIFMLPIGYIKLSIIDIINKYESFYKEAIVQKEQELAELSRRKKEKEDDDEYPW
ncbi:hypothetical protein [Dyadobacter alkalitolerans]|uniref:hypothetical protein n=1 Tax=Dyadobacter alkalitolerans TaxID=492736 RepID=UPI0003FC12C3|nr:hypothetical protein [Dyadobacter alkalitolerans]